MVLNVHSLFHNFVRHHCYTWCSSLQVCSTCCMVRSQIHSVVQHFNYGYFCAFVFYHCKPCLLPQFPLLRVVNLRLASHAVTTTELPQKQISQWWKGKRSVRSAICILKQNWYCGPLQLKFLPHVWCFLKPKWLFPSSFSVILLSYK